MPDVSDTLTQIPFFGCLSDRQVKRLAGKLKERQFLPGTSVVQAGEMSGIGFFVITDGEATVTIAENEVATLGPGDHFGELALIAERERTATVTAVTRLDCLELTAWDFREFVQSDPDVSWRLLQYVVDLLDAERSPGSQS
jgi:CRP/FNR family cyclic AMP-dependent transcriptional regulator